MQSTDIHVFQIADNIRCLDRGRRSSMRISTPRSSLRLAERLTMVERTLSANPGAFKGAKREEKSVDPYAAWKVPRHRKGPKFCSDFPSLEVTDYVGSGVLFPALSMEEAEAEFAEGCREATQPQYPDADSGDVDESDVEIDVVNFDSGDEEDSRVPSSRMEEDEDPFFVDGLSVPNVGGDASGSGGDEDVMVVEVPPGSAAGPSAGPRSVVIRRAHLPLPRSPVVVGPTTHQVDGDQEDRQQLVDENSQPSWTVLRSASVEEHH